MGKSILGELYSDTTIYRPQLEKNSLLLEVALGCSYHKCAFCDFSRDPFRVISEDVIEKRIKLLAADDVKATRLFLLGQNSFTLDFNRLCRIFDLAHQYLPSVKEFSMYARVDDINVKSTVQLEKLRDSGLKDLHIGVESGSDRVLNLCCKGVSTGGMNDAFARLDSLGIGYHITAIFGLGGKLYWKEHALQTAAFLNGIHPQSIWFSSLKVCPDTELFKMVERGLFIPLSQKEMLVEEKLLLENLTVDNCLYVHANALVKYALTGRLSQGKTQLLKALEKLSAL